MAEDNGVMNLDLNLGPVDISSDDDSSLGLGSYANADMSVDGWFDNDAVEFREVAQLRNHRWRSLWRHLPILPERESLPLELIPGNGLQTGEGSVPAEGRATEAAKVCESCTGFAEDKDLGGKKDSGKGNGDEGSFFDCNICLDLAKDPVVTCCGHLFCWPCLYRWLHHHSDANECPICKGEVTVKDVIPIYGRRCDKREPDVDSSFKIPTRPQARRIQGWRQVIDTIPIPMDDVIRHLEESYDLNRQITPEVHARNSGERSPYHGISITGGIRRDHQPPAIPDADLHSSGGALFRREEPAHLVTLDGSNTLAGSYHHRAHARRPRSAWIRRPHPIRGASLSNLTSNFTADSFLNRNHPVERNQEPDRDSVSSIAAVIHSESQTVDNAVEIDSTVARSTLSSRGRGDAARFSDVDSGESRSPWRRRLS